MIMVTDLILNKILIIIGSRLMTPSIHVLMDPLGGVGEPPKPSPPQLDAFSPREKSMIMIQSSEHVVFKLRSSVFIAGQPLAGH